jgi:Arf-GAP/SH3 domain/ANK repeat/PH domain-containing protein
MPGLISVSEFVEESREDVDSPTTSTFVSRMSQCRQTVAALEEVRNFDYYSRNSLLRYQLSLLLVCL